MVIFEDEGQQSGKHLKKHHYWSNSNIEVKRVPLPVGDYIIANEKSIDVISRKEDRGMKVKKMDFLGTYDVSVDTKKDMQEIVGNICGRQHGRFRDECILAQNNGIKLYVLIENEDGIKSIEDVSKWTIHDFTDITKLLICIGLVNGEQQNCQKQNLPPVPRWQRQ